MGLGTLPHTLLLIIAGLFNKGTVIGERFFVQRQQTKWCY
jgi:hypothetical protein